MATTVIYDGFDFASNGIILNNIDHLRIAPRQNQIETRANRSGGVLVQSQYGVKPITIEGYYIGSTITDAQNMYDTLAQALNRQERVLEVPHAGSTRRYIATPENLVIQEPDGLNKLTFSFEFVVPEGSSLASTSTTLFDTTITTASATIPITVNGSVTARPLITLTYSSVTGGTAKTMTLRNARDFIGLTFTRTFANGDVISIDSDNFQVYINGVLTEPDGRMPTWAPGTGSVYYSDTLTTRSVHAVGTYNQRNL